MEITLTSAELADLLTEAKRNGAHGAPDYTTTDAEKLIELIETRRNK